jgi:Domain of unknown function (DUF4336)
MKVQDTENIFNGSNSKDFSWRLWFTVPIYPFSRRRTICREIIKDTIWTFDQLQGIFYVVVPIRMTVVKLENGGLLIYAPVAPTCECIRLVNELVAQHGDVKYIILPTISGLEHKVFVGPFARRFPHSQVFIAPNQWSFPVNLPVTWLGLPGKRTHILPEDSSQTPFGSDFDYAILGPIDLKAGLFEEVAFFHRPSGTLLLTDSIVSIPQDPPAIIQLEPYPLLFHAKDSAEEIVEDNQGNRRQGWKRICLFAMYFQPSVLDVPPWSEVFLKALRAKDKSNKAYFGLYPFKWQENWENCFDALRGNGRLLVAPILQTLILNRAPKETLYWADKVASWNFQRIISCHFDSPIESQANEFRQAFSFLEKNPSLNLGYPLPEEDFKILKNIDDGLNRFNIVPPPQEKI